MAINIIHRHIINYAQERSHADCKAYQRTHATRKKYKVKSMKNILHTSLIITGIFFSSAIGAMEPDALNIKADEENQIQIIQLLPKEIIVHIIGYCKPKAKNALMKVCKVFHTWLQDRILIVQANPSTVSMMDKIEALVEYARDGNVKMTEFLLKNGVEANSQNLLGIMPLHNAHDDVKQLLIKHGAKATILKPHIPTLHEAVYNNDKETVKRLVELKVNPNDCLTNGAIPLCLASFKGYTEIVKLLLNADNIEVNETDYINKWTPLMAATFNDQIDIVKLLLEVDGIEVNKGTRNGFTPLYAASCKGHIELVKLLLKVDVIDVNKADNYGWTPLMTATFNDQINIIKLLLEVDDIEVNKAIYDNRITPLYYASSNSNTEIVKLLLNAGANVNQASDEGVTSLCIASDQGHTEVVKLLLKANNIKVNKANNNNATPLLAAAFKGYVDIVQSLINAQADVNLADTYGWTPLCAASYNGNSTIMSLLLDNGANIHDALTADSPIDPMIKKGDTVLQIAQKKGHTDIVALIEEHMRHEKKV